MADQISLPHRLILRLGRKALYVMNNLATSLSRSVNNSYVRYISKHRAVFGADMSSIDDSQERHSRLLKNYYKHLGYIVGVMPIQPKLSVVIPVYKVELEFLRQALASVAAQVYQNWEVCLVDDCSNSPEITSLIEKFSSRFPGKVLSKANKENAGISVSSNRALELATGEFVCLLDHDDLLYPNSLAEVVRYINLHDSPDILYSDETVVDQHGIALRGVYNKPSWSPLFHLSVNYTTHLSTYNTKLVRQVGGFRKGFEGSQDHDLMLRMTEATKKPIVHIPLCLYQWRAHINSTASSPDAKPYAANAGILAVTEACQRRNRPAEVKFETDTLHYRVSFKISKPVPLVSIVIPSKDRLDLISQCVTSIFSKSTYPSFEVILVDNGTTDANCLAYFEEIKKEHGEKIQIRTDAAPFNFARLNNGGVKHSKGSMILLLNNDTEVVSENWIEELVSLAQLPEVGAVGCLLTYPNGSIQHAGVMFAGRKIALHYYHKGSAEDLVYYAYNQTVHEVACITGACLMISKEKYLAVGGLDEVFVPNGFGDVDFALKLQSRGWSNVYTPYAKLIHHESPSRGVNCEGFEQVAMLKKWSAQLMTDPIRSFCQEEDAFLSKDPKRLMPEIAPLELRALLDAAFNG